MHATSIPGTSKHRHKHQQLHPLAACCSKATAASSNGRYQGQQYCRTPLALHHFPRAVNCSNIITAVACHIFVQPEDLKFRQNPTFADCFPGSEKCYNTVEFKGETMQVRGWVGEVGSCHVANGAL